MHRGNLETRCVCVHDMNFLKKMKMIAKGISHDDFSENGVGRWSYNYTSEEPMYCFGRFSNTFASEGSPIFLPRFGSVFSRITSFVLKMIFFSHMA